MTSIWTWLMTAKGRAYIYTIAIAAIAVAVGYQLLSPEHSALWLGLIAALLGIGANVTALKHITPDAPKEPVNE